MNLREHVEFQNGPFTISTDPARLDIDTIHVFLSTRAYWSPDLPRPVLEKAVRNSLCFGVYENGRQAGFARVVTDLATFAYICDLFILEEYRGKGLSKWLVSCILAHPELQNLRRWLLITRDAHGLYSRFGFTPAARPENVMEIVDLDIYRRLQQGQHRTDE
jgi:GNAT superfamily N-acetyltransferase